MTVKIRLEAADATELDAHETALRAVLDIAGDTSPDYPNHRRPDRRPRGDEEDRARRFLTSTGVRTTAAAAGLSPLAAAEDAKHARDLAAEIDILTHADAQLRAQPWIPLRPGDVVLSYLAGNDDVPAYGQTFVAVDTDTDADGNAMLRELCATYDPGADVDVVPPDPDAVEYLLRYDPAGQRWALDCVDAIGGDLQHWLDAPDGVSGEDTAQAWAAGEISDIEADRELTGWRELDGERRYAAVFAVDDAPVPVSESLTPLYDLWFEAGPQALTVIRAGTVVYGTPATEAAPAAMKTGA